MIAGACAAVIWDALRAACDADLATAKVILESAGVVVASDNMTVCYDERGEACPSVRQSLEGRHNGFGLQQACSICSAAFSRPHRCQCVMGVIEQACMMMQGICMVPARHVTPAGPALRCAGRKYELPKYVISTPSNVKLDGKGGTGATRQVELTAGGGSQAAGGSA